MLLQAAGQTGSRRRKYVKYLYAIFSAVAAVPEKARNGNQNGESSKSCSNMAKTTDSLQGKGLLEFADPQDKTKRVEPNAGRRDSR